MSDSSLDGHCLCGTVRFQIDLPTQFCAHCHCNMCQRNHGAAFVTWVRLDAKQMRILVGESALTHYPSSAHGVRSFCSNCGTSLICRFENEPDHLDIPLSTLDGELDRAPALHVFFDTHKPWVTHDDLPRLGGATGMEPIEDA